ncbi:unnamed protein product [Lampetra fluviatilis]
MMPMGSSVQKSSTQSHMQGALQNTARNVQGAFPRARARETGHRVPARRSQGGGEGHMVPAAAARACA